MIDDLAQLILDAVDRSRHLLVHDRMLPSAIPDHLGDLDRLRRRSRNFR